MFQYLTRDQTSRQELTSSLLALYRSPPAPIHKPDSSKNHTKKLSNST
jgi:hypothetical protein